MSFFDLFRIVRKASTPDTSESDTVRKIVRELDTLPREEARYLAGFAYVLGRAAHADREITDEETRMMELLVRELGGLSDQQAVLVVAMAKNQNRLFGGTESFLVTRELRDASTRDQREHLLYCAFAVAAADDSISSTEEAQLLQIASELGFNRADFVHIRSAYNDKREVVKLLRAARS